MAQWYPYYVTMENQWGAGAIDWDTDTQGGADNYQLKVAILASYTPAPDTEDFWNDVSASEISAVNYTAGGNACANSAITRSTNVITFDADDPADWSQNASGFSGTYRAVLYADSGVAATSPLLMYSSTFTHDTTVIALNLELSPSGIFTWTMTSG